MGTYEYAHIIEAKDGNLVPLCKSADTAQELSLHSKYNPVREAESFAASVQQGGSFFVVLGLAGGYHIAKLLERFPKSTILAVEISESAISFLSAIPLVQQLEKDQHVTFAPLPLLEEILLASYKPALHGNLTVLTLRQWESVFSEMAGLAREKITRTIRLLSADFSVQSHFGKIWQKNILTNLSLAEKTLPFESARRMVQTDKTAAIIAAGPSLDSTVQKLKTYRKSYYIIATDTAFSALQKHGIESDAVISIDGQQVSHEHYMGLLPQKTLYVFDLCANSSSIRAALTQERKVLLVETGHPLAQYASLCTGERTFLHVEAGSGTVTIAAASLAKKLGFRTLEFFGADFAYIGGCPYARGTYLESQFYSHAHRLDSAEKRYAALMYRTPTITRSEHEITTAILEAYKNSLANFLASTNHAEQSRPLETAGTFRLAQFKSQYCADLRSAFKSEDNFDESAPAVTTLLPLCAKLGKGTAFIAYLKTLRYTEHI